MSKENRLFVNRFGPETDFFDFFFNQSLVGFFFMETDEPIPWHPETDINTILTRFFNNQKITKFNRTFLDQYDFTEMDVLGMSPADFFKHDIEHGYEVCREIIKNGHITVITDERKSDGMQIWLEGNYSVIFDLQKNIIGLFGIQVDITDRINYETTLKESELRFRTLYENAAIGLYRTTPEGKIVMANPALIKMLGYLSHEDISKMNAKKDFYFDTDSRSKIVEKIEGIGGITGEESTWHTKDGTIIHVRENARAVRNNEGKILFYEGTIEDITERKLAIEALIESERKLRETNSTKDKFFSIIAHDLRSPFQGLLGIANILVEDEELTLEERLDYEKKLLGGLKIQFSLLDELLTWSRVQRGIIEFNPELNNLLSDVQEAIILLKDSFERKHHSMELAIPQDILIVYDKNMISTVIRNLLTNANKFTPDGGKISIRTSVDQNEIIVTVSDTGIGIPENDKDKIFRVDSHFIQRGTNDEGGTGLGLCLCKEFIEKHNGKIWMESKVGIGSSFNFSLPFHK
jgi:PAS domain S-box-containing protein